MIRLSPRVGLWRSWERASMAWKRSSVRSRPGPPILCDPYRLHPTKRKNKQVLHWLRNRSACSTDTASARTDYFNPWSRTLGLGISRAVRNISRSAAAGATAKELEVPSFDPGIDRRLEYEKMSASRLAGKVVGSIATRPTNRSTTRRTHLGAIETGAGRQASRATFLSFLKAINFTPLSSTTSFLRRDSPPSLS